jgi:carotenoid cleavage dioxygenase-like enzyme
MTDTQESEIFGTGEFYQRGNYAPVADELTDFDLVVEGSIPPELDGWYLRNGPNPRQATGHWFSGDGMLHGIRVEDGRAAWYRNRWVRTDSFENDFPLYNEDGTRNLRSAVANTHVVNHAGKTLALVESSLPYEVTNELETIGAYDFGGKLVDSMTAHPKICPTTGEMHFFGYGNIFEPYVTYHRVDANGELTINRPVDVKAMTMMHDFALTAEHVIFMDLPIVFDVEVAAKGDGDMPFRWSDEYGARLGVMRRDDPFGPIRWFEIDPCYVFHVANAYDSGNTIVLQAARYPELWRSSGGFEANAVMWTWTIDLARGTVSERQLDEHTVEFPRIDDRLAGLQARFAVSVGNDKLVRQDLTTGNSVEHAFGTAASPGVPGEAVFVPSDGPADESAGYYLGYVYDPARNGSDLVILDASDFAADPVATIKLPHRVPFGFHGNWIGA